MISVSLFRPTGYFSSPADVLQDRVTVPDFISGQYQRRDTSRPDADKLGDPESGELVLLVLIVGHGLILLLRKGWAMEKSAYYNIMDFPRLLPARILSILLLQLHLQTDTPGRDLRGGTAPEACKFVAALELGSRLAE